MDTPIDAPVPTPSPWLTIWFSPRMTIRRIVDAEEPRNWWPVIALAAVGHTAGALVFDPDGSLSLSQSFMPVVIGLAQTIFGVLVGPFLLAFVGSWFGGEADPSEIRQAIAWGYVPFAVAGLLWIPLAFWYQGQISASDTGIPLAVVPLMLAVAIGAFWSVVTQVVTLAEVQRISILHAIASIAVVIIPALLLGLF